MRRAHKWQRTIHLSQRVHIPVLVLALTCGRLGPVTVTVGEGTQRREYRVGDRVIVTANDCQLGVLNGTRADVTAIDPRHRSLT